jgi:hypothetical protein
MFTQTWVIEGESFGPFPISYERSHAELHRPFSIAWFCPFCGDIWARRIIAGEGKDSTWTLYHIPCSKHPHSLSRGLSGSVWLSYETDFLNHMPLPVIRREALLHLGANNFSLSEPTNVQAPGLPSQATIQPQDDPAEPQSQRLVSARARFYSPQKGV